MTRRADRWFIGSLLGIGIGLRLIQFFSNRSIYIDEAALALNLRNRSFSELLSTPLDFAQTAPPAFLIQQKLLLIALGEHEFVLRFVPLLAGVVSIPVFAVLARRLLPAFAAHAALALFAFAYPLIYFAADSKPYMVDLLVTVATLYLSWEFCVRPITWRRTAGFAAFGAVAAWLSQPSVFVLGGAGIAILRNRRETRQPKAGRALLVVLAAWACSSVGALLFALSTLSANDRSYMHDFWISGFMPVPPNSLSEALWLPFAVYQVAADPLGAFLFPALMSFVLMVGVFELRKVAASHALLVGAPVLLTLLASALGQYPFGATEGDFPGRVLLFLAPSLFLMVGAGVQGIVRLMGIRLAIPAVVTLLAINAAPILGFPIERDELRPVLEHVAENRQPSDAVYVYYASRHVYDWYADRFDLDDARPTYGACSRDNPAGYVEDVQRVRAASRVWVIFSHAIAAEARLILSHFELNGLELDRISTQGAGAVLYSLRSGEPSGMPADAALLTPDAWLEFIGCRGLYAWPT